MTRTAAGLPVRPYQGFTGEQVNANNSLRAVISSRDFDNQPEAPTLLEYRLDNMTDNVVVTDWTTIVSPDETTELTLTPTQNAMYTTWRDTQLMQLTFRATYSDGTQARVVQPYELCAIAQAMG